MIRITVIDTGIGEPIARLLRGLQNPRPALKAIGELVMESTKERFALSQDPYGKPWAANADSTLAAYLHRDGRSFTKKGQVSARGKRLLAAKKPLIGQSKSLSTQFDYAVVSSGVDIFSTIKYAAMQQFGGTKAKFPHLWGDIPARPFFPDAKRGLPPALAQRIETVLAEAILGGKA
ncbi:MAG TPA: phage virion morphogenesis protein [Candidatus Accumulibacter phosphatis]|nr:phage virion morphogenesis protein [Candidatus Accumulibacter phosphatis]